MGSFSPEIGGYEFFLRFSSNGHVFNCFSSALRNALDD
jgi:hypothetical protein